jgi:hypothetical protein
MNYLAFFQSAPQSFFSFDNVDKRSSISIVAPVFYVSKRRNRVGVLSSIRPRSNCFSTFNRTVFWRTVFSKNEGRVADYANGTPIDTPKFYCARNTPSGFVVNKLSTIRAFLVLGKIVLLGTAKRAKAIVFSFRRWIDTARFANRGHLSLERLPIKTPTERFTRASTTSLSGIG